MARNSCQPTGSHSSVDTTTAMANLLTRFGQHLRALRLRQGISQEELAAEAGLHRTYVSSVERGERNISLVNIGRLARALGVPLREMLPADETRRSGSK
jgi:transcriptional regulator with XRE-family HTH domain